VYNVNYAEKCTAKTVAGGKESFLLRNMKISGSVVKNAIKNTSNTSTIKSF
jgi:hypothetical protein